MNIGLFSALYPLWVPTVGKMCPIVVLPDGIEPSTSPLPMSELVRPAATDCVPTHPESQEFPLVFRHESPITILSCPASFRTIARRMKPQVESGEVGVRARCPNSAVDPRPRRDARMLFCDLTAAALLPKQSSAPRTFPAPLARWNQTHSPISRCVAATSFRLCCTRVLV